MVNPEPVSYTHLDVYKRQEQDIAIDIKNTPVDSAQVITSIAQTVYGEIYPSKKFKHDKYEMCIRDSGYIIVVDYTEQKKLAAEIN